MVQILDDEHLDNLRCSNCHKYLSVFPVKNQVARDVWCGRCSRNDNDGVQSFLYELIAEKYLFRCINRYEGCRKLLRVEETEAHETKCVGNVFECPKCKDGTERHVLELIWHYKVQHPSSYLKRNEYEGRAPTEDAMLYVRDDVVFFILLQYEPSLKALRLNAVTLTEMDVTQSFSIIKGSRFERTERRRCQHLSAPKDNYYCVDLDPGVSVEVIFDLQVSKAAGLYDVSLSTLPNSTAIPATKQSNSKHRKRAQQAKPKKILGEPMKFIPIGITEPPCDDTFIVQLTAKFEKHFRFELNDPGTALFLSKTSQGVNLACSNCARFIGHPSYKCTTSQHEICHSCRTWCGICDCDVIPSDTDEMLLKIISLLRFPCKWGCGHFSSSDHRAHESKCNERGKSCPVCRGRVPLNFMANHLFTHRAIYFCEEYDLDQIQTFVSKESDGEVYFLLNDRWCSLTWSYTIYGYNQWCDLNFAALDDDPNIKLGVVFNNSKCSYDTSKKLLVRQIPLFIPYLKFNAT